jgi:nucleolar protein 16
MGRELQKRKNRSSRPKIRQPVRRRKALNPSGSQLIAQNWNKKETLNQNYRRLGLVAKLGHSAGGVEPRDSPLNGGSGSEPKRKHKTKDAFGKTVVGQVYSEAKVERDPETGKIIRVITGGVAAGRPNPLNDPLARFDEDEEDEAGEDAEEWEGIDEEEENKRPAVIRQLEKEANAPREKTVRYQSEREMEWLQKLVEKHGDDTAAMARDIKLNPMQQTGSDIRRRLKKAGLLAE